MKVFECAVTRQVTLTYREKKYVACHLKLYGFVLLKFFHTCSMTQLVIFLSLSLYLELNEIISKLNCIVTDSQLGVC